MSEERIWKIKVSVEIFLNGESHCITSAEIGGSESAYEDYWQAVRSFSDDDLNNFAKEIANDLAGKVLDTRGAELTWKLVGFGIHLDHAEEDDE